MQTEDRLGRGKGWGQGERMGGWGGSVTLWEAENEGA